MKYGIHSHDNKTGETICWIDLDLMGRHLDTIEEAEQIVNHCKEIDVEVGDDISYEIVEI